MRLPAKNPNVPSPPEFPLTPSPSPQGEGGFKQFLRATSGDRLTTMTGPLRTTFDYLRHSNNPHASALLLRAVDGNSTRAGRYAVEAILHRNDVRLHEELIRRYRAFPPDWQQLINEAHAPMNEAVSRGLLSRDDELRKAALFLVHHSEAFAQLDNLLRLVIGGGATGAAALEALQSLVNRLYEHIQHERSPGQRGIVSRSRRRRDRVVDVLGKWIPRFRTAACLPELIEAALMVGRPDDAALRRLLTSAEPDLVKAAWERLASSTHPGVVGFLIAALPKRWSSSRVVGILHTRDDPEFVVQLLRCLPDEFRPSLRSALQNVQSLPWLGRRDPTIDWIPAALQGKLVMFLQATGLDGEQKMNVLRWVLHHGGVEGRTAVAEILSQLDERHVEQAVVDGLRSEDVQVQSWATSRLRARATPEAFSLLINQLDSPSEQVRATAREELRGFNLRLVLELFDDLLPMTCLRAGRLITKIDPDSLNILREELYHPIRQRRIRAIRAARAFGVHHQCEPELLELLADPDYVVRRTIIDVLSEIPTPAVDEELRLLLGDENVRIREAAAAALASRERRALRSSTSRDDEAPAHPAEQTASAGTGFGGTGSAGTRDVTRR